jgi:glycosyltransferase involved in cell wall biosynthesis
MHDSISIIIPTLNEEKFIASCLDSVLKQTYPSENMDIMVIDGGSTDKTQEIVEAYHTLYDNIRLIHNPGKIQSIAFNLGVKQSTAPYIIRLDAHVTYDMNYIANCINGLKHNEKIGNIGGVCKIQPVNASLWAVTNAILNQSKFGIGGATFRIGGEAGEVDTVPFGCFPRKVIETVGGMREDLARGEDNEYNSRIKKAGYIIYFDPAIVSTYYSRPTLRTSCKQMFANGESIGNLLYIDKSAIGIRHFIPLLFVLYIILIGALSMASKYILCLYLCGIGLYFVCDILASFYASFKYGIKYFIPLFLMFFCVHISYGLGTIKGIITHTK